MNEQTGTITDPIWVDVVVAAVFVLVVLTVFVIAEAIISTVVRRWREAGAQVDQCISDGLAEIDLDRWDAEVQR